ncbi:MAG: cell division protein FtsH, partial [Erysipelotrichia bacterium]|nr:cell division protein FtsH [Erysipelotrichia bacterium]
ALGYTLQLPLEDKYLTTKKELLDQLVILLGGRSAETIFCDEITTGAQNDLQRATSIANKIVCEFGMDDKLGNVVYKKGDGEVFLGRDISRERSFSNETLKVIDDQIRLILENAFETSKKYIQDNRDKMEKLVSMLLEKEVVNAEELEAIFSVNQ